MFKRDIWCLWWCSAFKPSSLNKINCGDAGLAICSVTVGGGRGGGMHPTASIGPHEISGSRDWIPLWFYWGSGEAEWARPASIFRLSFVIHITLGLFLLSPQPPLVHISVQPACRMSHVSILLLCSDLLNLKHCHLTEVWRISNTTWALGSLPCGGDVEIFWEEKIRILLLMSQTTLPCEL